MTKDEFEKFFDANLKKIGFSLEGWYVLDAIRSLVTDKFLSDVPDYLDKSLLIYGGLLSLMALSTTIYKFDNIDNLDFSDMEKFFHRLVNEGSKLISCECLTYAEAKKQGGLEPNTKEDNLEINEKSIEEVIKNCKHSLVTN